MILEEIKVNCNAGLERVKKAEKVAEDDPSSFEKYIAVFNKICRNMSDLMDQYENITGHGIPEHEFQNGFKIN